MREIKFRAWDKKEIVLTNSPGYLINFHGDLYTVDNTNGVTYYKRDDWVLMQYTGLKDKNGKDIYEGDICKGYGFHDEPNEYHKDAQIGVCKFQAGSFIVENINHTTIRGGEVTLKYKVEVIGNIYDNPELIKV